MMYMKNGALIRMVADREVPRFAARGFVPLAPDGEKPAKKPVRKQKEAGSHGGT